jgi:hypothetical protein
MAKATRQKQPFPLKIKNSAGEISKMQRLFLAGRSTALPC